jgi:hypothetical protein
MADPDDFDLEELVASLTPRRDEDSVAVYQNTVSIACPACGDAFDDLVICREEFTSLDLSAALDLCTTVRDGNAVLFTHRR